MELKVFVDKKRNRVVFAESNNDFVDVLLSFLTLPMATIIRLTRNQSQPSVFGSMRTLYQGVENLHMEYFWYNTDKSTLLHPSNSCEYLCRKLKLNIDDTKPTKFYICDCCQNDRNALIAVCDSYVSRKGMPMNKAMHLVDEVDNETVDTDEGVFVKGTAAFIITDDLKVMPASPSNCIEILSKMGIKGFDSLRRMIVKVTKVEVLSLLGLSFGSKTPLTDMILSRNTELRPIVKVHTHAHFNNLNNHGRRTYRETRLKLILRKSDSKILYAEAKGSFVNYLLGQLVMPLGAIMELLHQTPSLQCISNLYKSVAKLVVGLHLKSENVKNKLLSPKFGAHYGDLMHSLVIDYVFCTENPCKFRFLDSNMTTTIDKINASDSPSIIGNDSWFVKDEALFMITDDLTVSPLSTASCISIFQKFNVAIRNIEERVVHIGKEEALQLLAVSLISDAALTSVFSFSRSAKKQKLDK